MMKLPLFPCQTTGQAPNTSAVPTPKRAIRDYSGTNQTAENGLLGIQSGLFWRVWGASANMFEVEKLPAVSYI